jgi:putative transposase
MSSDNLISLPTPEPTETFHDALSELVRTGARQIIAQAVEAELQEFLAQYVEQRDEQGRQGVVRNGYLPERTIQTGVGDVAVKVPKVRDRNGSGIKFNSRLFSQDLSGEVPGGHRLFIQRPGCPAGVL